jgi:hypothetical protein
VISRGFAICIRFGFTPIAVIQWRFVHFGIFLLLRYVLDFSDFKGIIHTLRIIPCYWAELFL